MTFDVVKPTTPVEAVINFGFQSVNSALKLGEELSHAKTPTDVANAVTSYNQRYIESLGSAFHSIAATREWPAAGGEKRAGPRPSE